MPTHPNVKRVLIYRLGSLGDTVVATPCFHLIERAYPNAERRLLTNFPVHAKAPASAAILGGSGGTSENPEPDFVHGYMRYSVGTRSPLELLRLAREIRRFQPEVLVYLMPVRPSKAVQRDKWFFRLACGIRQIVGLPDASQLTRNINPSTNLYEAEAHRLARTVSALGDAAIEDLANWDLRLTPKEREAARFALGPLVGQPLILCGPGTKMQAKDWGQENWRSLLDRLALQHSNHALALIGAKEDAEIADFASAAWPGPKVNLCGRLSPRETAAAFELATAAGQPVFLGPDSGPMHLAAAAAVPCVIAFAARGLPGVWYPTGNNHQVIYHQVSCSGCNLETCITEGRRCLTSITVDEMAEATASVLTPIC